MCWSYGEATDRALSASCRIDQRGTVSCWREDLEHAPSGDFIAVDDNGFNACALDARGRAVCWGSARRGWHEKQVTEPFVAVRVGGTSPVHMGHGYACGLTDRGHVRCWEEDRASETFSLPGEFVAVDAGYTVCGITRANTIDCLPSAQMFTQPEPPAGRFTAVAVGVEGEHCTLDFAKRASCWVTGPPGALPIVVDGVATVRTGHRHGCMVRFDGTIACVGDARPPPNVRVKYLSRPASVTENYCAVTLTGERLCWGDPTP